MPYTVENVNDCTRKLIFTFDSVDLSKEIETALKQKQKTAKLKGFRPGKAPLSVIQKFYGPQVENEALYSFVSKEFYNAIQEEKIQPIGYPKFDNTKYESEKKSVEFEATVEIFPEFTVKGYEKYKFEREDDSFKEEDIEKVQNQLLESKSELVAIEDDSVKLSDGHFAVLNFQGEKEDGEKPANMKGEEFQLEIGSGQFIEGFEEGMKGMKKGESKTLDLTFPADYHSEDLKSAKVKFHVDLLEIKQKNRPEFTDELAKEFNYDSVADFKEKTKKRIESENKRKADEKLHQEILEKLVSDNSFDVPEALVLQQLNALKEDTKRGLMQSGFNDVMMEEYFKKWNDNLKEKAEFQVRSGLILNKLADEFEVKADESELEGKYQDMADMSGMSVEEIKKVYAGNENIKNNLLYALKEEKTFDVLKSKFKVS